MKRIFFLGILFLVCIPIGYYFMSAKKEKPLPIINPIDVNEEMVDPEMLRLGFGHHIGSFSFQNQDAKFISTSYYSRVIGILTGDRNPLEPPF